MQKKDRYNGTKRMNLRNFSGYFTNKLLALSLVSLLIWPMVATAAIEQTFDVLQIGTHTYKNVTVTTKAKNYIFILHSAGMNNVKVSDLPGDIRDKLGYNTVNETASVGTNGISGWARQTMAKIETPRIKELEKALRGH